MKKMKNYKKEKIKSIKYKIFKKESIFISMHIISKLKIQT